MPRDSPVDRRTFLKTTGAAAATAATVSLASPVAAGDSALDDAFDLTTDVLQEALVVFDANDQVSLLDRLDLANGYHHFDVLPIGYTELTVDQLQSVAGWDEVRYVQRNVELDYYNDDVRDVTRAGAVQSDLGYDGSRTHTAVIDSGVDPAHPDLGSSVVANYQWTGNLLGDPTLWVDAGTVDTDDNGHGTHCSGTIAGDGSASDGQYKGMAPATDLTVYSAGLTLLIVKPVAAFDHLLSRIEAGETDVKLVSNSYGSSNGNAFDPDDALNVATWEAFERGLLPLFAAGNSGSATNTLNQYAKAPNVLGVAASNDAKAITDFSSRGRPSDFDGPSNHDRPTALDNLQTYHETGSASGPLGVYRPGIVAPGDMVVSTLMPTDALDATNPDTMLYYGAISGTSMACPGVAGIAAAVTDAYRANNTGTLDPADLLYTLTGEADETADSGYTAYNAGAGFVDAYDSAVRAENGNLGTSSDVTLSS